MSVPDEYIEKTTKELEKEGLKKVRIKLKTGGYQGGNLIRIVQAWVENKEIEIAENANKIAKLAIFVSVISFLISLLVAVFK